MQTVSSKIWTVLIEDISFVDNRYTMNVSYQLEKQFVIFTSIYLIVWINENQLSIEDYSTK